MKTKDQIEQDAERFYERDTEEWVSMCETLIEEDACSHEFHTVYKGDNPSGQRCNKCQKQEWY